MPSNFQLRRFPDDEVLSAAAAQDWLAQLQSSTGPYAVALSGGRITKSFFAAVMDLAKASGAALARVHFFWADERCVPPGDPESNYRLADENLFRPLGIGPAQIHRLKGELPPAAAVAEANADIRRMVPGGNASVPILDMIFLGMGEDGHIASLMPNALPDVLESREPFVHVSNSPKPPPDRLTMTYPVLAAARNIWVLVTGAGKAGALRDSLNPGAVTPLARVLGSRRQTIIYTDLNKITARESN
jgi:6-phosphogluconolactonase